jgi:hypothetical protein
MMMVILQVVDRFQAHSVFPISVHLQRMMVLALALLGDTKKIQLHYHQEGRILLFPILVEIVTPVFVKVVAVPSRFLVLLVANACF